VAEWLTLAATLGQCSPAPCEEGGHEAWWPADG
jgi:hypothetical protein